MGFFSSGSKPYTGSGNTGNCVNPLQHEKPQHEEVIVQNEEGRIVGTTSPQKAQEYVEKHPEWSIRGIFGNSTSR